MFDNWRMEDEYAQRVVRVFSPPRPVLVDVASTLPPSIGRSLTDRQRLPCYLRGWGLRLETWMPGRQIAWVQQSTSTWWAVVDVDAWAGNRLSRLTMHLWTRPEALVLDTPDARRTRRMHEIGTAPWNRADGTDL
ncbi:hypothetical protein P0W64_19190 [Tsukamurella sp. 8F]|uniref:hypothetical protein n=1 Tax=unclassified Tsukamurella TaxID=2633480 RepID=UPI0023BA17A9|nr:MULTISPECIES: hypothetical protein [unclassified Tsukamurella]MDF0531665.1 hypothetical protein [Tsukamurella sp. 8J]MDF0588911.1 hypothetical protein [Tsukamurella sp. 8F]